MHSTYDALVPVQISHDDPRRELPTDEERTKTTEETKKAYGVFSSKFAPKSRSELNAGEDEDDMFEVGGINDNQLKAFQRDKQFRRRLQEMRESGEEPPSAQEAFEEWRESQR